MEELIFKWDEYKAVQNIKKHKVSFEEAQTVFYDESAILYYDDSHSESEERFLLLGLSSKLRILLICHCYREHESVIRIISARKATKKEAKHYLIKGER